MVAWEMLKGFSKTIPDIQSNKTELTIYYPNGGIITLLGAENADNLRGNYWDSVVMDEVSQMRRSVWSEIVRPALSDRNGKGYFIGTPQGRNAFHEFYQQAGRMDGWYRRLITYKDSGYINESEIAALKQELSTAEFEQEFECSWNAAIRGAYYGEVMNDIEANGQIRHVPHDENLGVQTAFDLGMSNSTVVWFMQRAGSEIRAIECRAFIGTGLPEIFRWIKENVPHYHIDQWIGPHDLKVRELGTGVSRLEVAYAHGVSFTIAKKIPVQDGIDATRSMLKRTLFDAELCKEGIEALRQYKSEYDEKRGAFSTQPLHDWTSDYADGLRYYAVATSGGQRTGGMNQAPLPLDLTGTF